MRLPSTSLASYLRITHVILVCSGLFICVSMIGCEKEPSKVTTLNQEPAIATLQTENINSEAINILKRGLDYLSALEKFNVTTQNTLEDVINDSYRIDYETSSDLTIHRPDKVRIERYGLEMHQLFFFNGNQFTLHNPYHKVYATRSLKGSLEDMFHIARDTFGLSAPSSDLIYSNSFELLSQNIRVAEVIGKEMINEVMCDHLLFIRPNVSFQIWISESAPYLPYKYIVTDTSTPHLLSYSTLMTQWNLEPEMSDTMFEFSSTEDVHQIEFIPINTSQE